jgi:hypothetical protein
MADVVLTHVAHEALHARAEGIQRDVSGDFPELDASYDTLVELVEGEVVGVIHMGDCGAWAFTWREGAWQDDYALDAHALYERIMDARMAR